MSICSLVPVFVASLLSQDVQFTKEGPYYQRTDNGAAGMAQTRLLKVSTRGRIVLRGFAGDQVTYRLVERVKARSEDEAHRMFGSSAISVVTRGPLTTLVVAAVTRESVITRLEVNVPRRLIGVILDTKLGDIEAYDVECNLRAETTAGQIQCDRIRGSFEGGTGGGEIHLGKIGGSVRCLNGAGSIIVDNAGGDANCQTAGGEITIHEAGGPLVLSTEGGNIQVDKAASSVQAHTAEGVIEIFQAGGAVIADTRGGSIQVGSARGAKCESAMGAIRVKTSSGPLHINTAMGSILAELLAGTHLEESSLVAGSGDVTVLIPSNLSLSVLARNDTGGNPRIVSDFKEVRAMNVGVRRPPLVYEGAINGGGPLLTVNTSGGIIYLRKLK
jgi:DUF4097 and DUF4098 domain-containing protein YvlB